MNNPDHYRRLVARLFAAALLMASVGIALAGVHYVDVNSTNATPPYTSWAKAATNIQDAVDAAAAGDEILVTNGIYATGARTEDGFTFNRVAVDKPLTLRSANGPQFTIIDGDGSVRCVYLASDASLSGFTLRNGVVGKPFTSPMVDGVGGGVRCAAQSAVVSNCVITGNVAREHGTGGGAYGGTLNNCTLIGNSSQNGSVFCVRVCNNGGGASHCILNNCILTNNSAAAGGGASSCTLNHCTLIGNSGGDGGGAVGGTLNNCTLRGNSGQYGGGAKGSTLNNCALTGNSASRSGGGAAGCILNNCTLIANSAPVGGGASYAVGDEERPPSTLNNCIVYFNSSTNGANYDSSCILNYSCTTPLPINGVGNISSDPQLASSSHLSAGSPCRAAGSAAYANGMDIDGELWTSPPSIGCDEYHGGAVAGPLNVVIASSFTNVPVGFAVKLTALIEGRTAGSSWDFGDGIAATNQPYVSHAWMAVGNYVVTLRGYNESQPAGISATTTVHVVNGVHYVASGSANPLAPYTSWATAATTIQEAVDAAIEPGAAVVVTNGIYAPIEVFAGPAAELQRLLHVRSVNGQLFTVIDGGHSNRCVSLANDAVLSGFIVAFRLGSV